MEDIEKKVTLDCDVERAWKALTDKDELSRWMMMPTNFKPEVGTKFYFQANPNENWTGKVSCEVKAVEKNKKLSFTWNTDLLKTDTLVSFTLNEVDEKTELTLVHSGWENVKEDSEDMKNLHNEGWGQRLFEKLKVIADSKFIV